MSEEIVKIIEKLQNIFQKLRKDDEEGHSSTYELQWEDIEAIENLIQENKDLKEIINNQEQKYISVVKDPTKILFEQFSKDYIPKSIVKEKIEELIKEGDYRSSDNPRGRIHFQKEDLDYKIEVLQELLED